jgi:P-type Cu2+ transporter
MPRPYSSRSESTSGAELLATDRTIDRPAASAPCAHCGLPVGRRPVGGDPWFCCTGCEIVHQSLVAAGIDDTYYRLRQVGRAETRPAATEVDELVLAELDSDDFLTSHTTAGEADSRSVDLFLDGVHCAACVWLVERLPYEMEGVVDARLDLPRARLTLTWKPAEVALRDIATWLSRFGYRASPLRGQASVQRTREERALLIRAGVAWALAGNVMLLAFAMYSGLGVTEDSPALARAARWLSFALAIPAVGYAGNVFFLRAWASIQLSVRNRTIRTLHMDTPIALGIAVGFIHSAWATITGTGDVWFDSLAVLIAALLTARWLQLRSRRLAGDASERLLSLIPTMVRRVRSDGSLETVASADIRAGDSVSVPAGEVFPVDGVVASGTSLVNNAVLTGEARLDAVEAGSEVAAGATNVRSNLIISVRAAGSETRVGRLLAWVRDGSRRGAPVVLLADRLAGYFVLTVLLLATFTAFLWWQVDPSRAAMNVVALLVITCPCALGMATPLAMAVGAGKAARAGIFIKTDEAMQALASADCIVLDKTGTITEGSPRLTSVVPVGETSVEELLALAASVEVDQSHPVARAIISEYEERSGDLASDPDAVTVIAGSGIAAETAGRAVLIGRTEWVIEATDDPDAEHVRSLAAQFASQGQSPVAIALDGRLEAVLAFGDRLREDARPTIDALRRSGRAVYLLSGDHAAVAITVGADAGVDVENIVGGASPEDKEAVIRELRTRHKSVVMIGDGVNDAAALQAAHVGIAMHGGSTVSLVAADVFLTRDGVAPLLDLLHGSRRVMHVIRRNLGMSLAYNVFGAAIAMAGLVTPLFAAVAMPLSSLAVVGSSILQRPFPARPRPPLPPRTSRPTVKPDSPEVVHA